MLHSVNENIYETGEKLIGHNSQMKHKCYHAFWIVKLLKNEDIVESFNLLSIK